MSWLKVPNFYAYVALVVLGGAIVTGIYLKGAKDEQRKHDLATARLNTKLVALRATDEAQLGSEATAAKAVDEAVRKALSKRFVLDEETARELDRVR